MPLLLEACPSFEEAWQEHVHDNGSGLLYVAAGTFARHLLSLYRSGELSSLAAVGTAIERLYSEGSPWVEELATVGLLEGIQNVWFNSGANPEDFTPFLGRHSRTWWNGLDRFWSGDARNVRAGG